MTTSAGMELAKRLRAEEERMQRLWDKCDEYREKHTGTPAAFDFNSLKHAVAGRDPVLLDAAAFLSHPVDTGQGVGDEEIYNLIRLVSCIDTESPTEHDQLLFETVVVDARALLQRWPARPPLASVEGVVTRIDILREWFGGERYARDYEYLDANYSEQANRVVAYLAALAQSGRSSAEPVAWTVRVNDEETDSEGTCYDVLLPTGEWRGCIAVDPQDARDTMREEWEKQVTEADLLKPPAGYATPPVGRQEAQVKTMPEIIGYEVLGTGKMQTEAWADTAQYHPPIAGAGEEDRPENTTDNPKSWIAWKRRAEAAETANDQLNSRIRELERENERLLDCLRKDPNTVLIAHENGDHERLSRGLAKAIDRAEAAEARIGELERALAEEKSND